MAHILLLTDRDWTHPQGGGTGANLFGQVAYWLEWGHRVTVVSGTYDGAAPVERPAPGLELHHMGSRVTVFPRAAWAVRRGLARDADVVLEVVNGITFLTPLWLRRPRVTLVHHIHRDHYVTELGRVGAVAALVNETLPLKLLYGGAPFLTISESAKADIVDLGVPEEDVHVGYLGVVPFDAPLPARSETPRLLYLGRLKRYKRIELLLDVVAEIPGAVLDVAGEGDHRPELEAEIARRGLADRVVLHGHVSEAEKASLYARAWVNLTASSAEGWCLTVMEAATCGTPSAALRVGGLPESIVDGETGLLADDGPGLTAAVGRLVADEPLRTRMGEAARARAAEFTWERTARESLDLLESTAARERVSLRSVLARSETLKAVGMAAATMANNALALVFTVLFARLLGAEDYGSLAALVSTLVILMVPGSAVQVAVAREIALGRLGSGPQVAATLAIWRRRLLLVGAAVTAAAVLLREPIADLISVPEEWAAAATATTAVLWLLLCVERGALQGVHAYKPVAWSIVLEAFGRLVFGVALLVLGMGVAGAFLGTPLSLLVNALGLWWIGRQRFGRPGVGVGARRLWDLVGGAWTAVLALFLVAVLQNVDVIMVKRQIGGEAAGAYAAAAVAAKAVVWVAIGIGLHLLPEATRAARHGENARPFLARALLVVAAVALPMLLVYAIAPETVLRLAFGEDTVVAADALFVLGLAMTLLAVCYLVVQYLLAIGRLGFLPALAVDRGRGDRPARRAGDRVPAHVRDDRAGRAGDRGGVRARDRVAGAGPATRDRAVTEIEGWLTEAQAQRLAACASRASGAVVEIGSFRGRSTVVLARAAGSVVAIDPHGGGDRGPQEITPDAALGDADHEAFAANLEAAGVADRVRHVRKPSAEAHADVSGQIAMLFVDGAHRFRPARDDVAHWGARVAPGGTMLVHDAFSSIGVTAALFTVCAGSRTWRYAGRTGSLAEYERRVSPGSYPERAIDALRHALELPWFARNVAIKVLVLAGRRPWAERLGLDPAAPWPY